MPGTDSLGFNRLTHRLGQVQVRDDFPHHRHERRTSASPHRALHAAREQADRRVQPNAVLAAFVPLAGFVLIALSAQRHGLLLLF